MFPYITLDDYQTMGGKAADDDFTRLAVRASLYVDKQTHRRIRAMSDVPVEVKRLLVEIIAVMAAHDQAGDSVFVTQESQVVGGVHSTRAFNKDRSFVMDQLDGLTQDYLTGVEDDNGIPLLYLGR